MKILMVQNIDGVAGSERFLLNIIPELIKRGFDIEFLILKPRNSAGGGIELFKETLLKFNIKVNVVNRSFFNLLKIKKVVESNNFDLIHSHLIHADTFMALVKWIFKRKTILISTKHGFDEKYMEKYGLYAKKRFNLFILISKIVETQINKSITVSNGLLKLYEDLRIIPKLGFKTIYHGTFSKELPAKNINWKKKIIFLIVGRLISLKGHKDGIRFFKKVNREINSELHIIGQGPLERELRDFCESEGVSKFVKFHGFKNDLETYYKMANFVVIPSKAEGFGLVAIEAFSFGLPVISKNTPALNEIVEHESNGLLFDFNDVEKDAKSFLLFFRSQPNYLRCSKNALLSANHKFSFNVMIDEIDKFYQEFK